MRGIMEDPPTLKPVLMKFLYYSSFSADLEKDRDKATHNQPKAVVTIPTSNSLRQPLDGSAVSTYMDFLVRKITEERETWVKIKPSQAQEIFRHKYPQFKNSPLPIDMGPLVASDGMEASIVSAPLITTTLDGGKILGLCLFSYDRGRKDSLWILNTHKVEADTVETVIYHKPYFSGEGFSITGVKTPIANRAFLEKRGDITGLSEALNREQLMNLARSKQKLPKLFTGISEGVERRETMREAKRELRGNRRLS